MMAMAEAARALAILFSAITGGRMALYEIAVLGDPSSEQLRDLERGLQEAADAFQLRFGVDLILQTNPAQFAPPQRTTARSDERREGKESVSTCRSRWAP